MQVLPVAVVGQLDVFDAGVARFVVFHRQRQGHGAVGCGDDTAVSPGLFDIMLTRFQRGLGAAVKVPVPGDGTEISGGEQG